jgi:hypothetical protein
VHFNLKKIFGALILWKLDKFIKLYSLFEVILVYIIKPQNIDLVTCKGGLKVNMKELHI